MTKTKTESGEVLEASDEQAVARMHSSQGETRGRNPVGDVAEIYDALDYRLMATFPASDAVARY